MVNFQVEVFARIFTMIGKDMARSGCLTELTVHLRDAFLCSHHLDLDDSTRKKLLHLIELQSGRDLYIGKYQKLCHNHNSK